MRISSSHLVQIFENINDGLTERVTTRDASTANNLVTTLQQMLNLIVYSDQFLKLLK